MCRRFFFFVGLPDEGAAFGSLSHLLKSFRRYGFYQSPGEDKIDELLNRGYILIDKNKSGETQVFANRLSLKVTASVAKEVMAYLGLDKDTPIVHKTSYRDLTGKTITLEHLL